MDSNHLVIFGSYLEPKLTTSTTISSDFWKIAEHLKNIVDNMHQLPAGSTALKIAMASESTPTRAMTSDKFLCLCRR